MERLGAVDVHVLDPVGGVRNGLCINPAIGFRGVLRAGVAQHQRGANDQRGVDAMTARAILAVDVEAKVARFLVGMPFEQDRSVGAPVGIEG